MSLAPLTTFRVGGPADWLVEPRTSDEIVTALKLASEAGVPVTMLGGGSNVLVSDDGVRGLVIRPRGGEVSQVDEARIRADAAVTINGLVRWTISHGCAGLEAWAGTPGTVGGGIYGNAHFGGRLIGDLVTEVRLAARDGTIERRAASGDGLRLRSQPTADVGRGSPVGGVSRFGGRAGHAAGDGARIAGVSKADAAARQPERRLHLSRIRNRARDAVPDGLPWSAGALVDRAGLKGLAIGGARVSPTHGNFIVNDGSATARDIRQLITRCQDAVRARFGVELREEIVYLGNRNVRSWTTRLMSTLAIEGGHPLSGSVDVEGNKNSALPLLAACLLTTEECVLTNMPRISDVEVMARLLIDLGATVDGIGTTTLRVRCPTVVKDEPDPALVGRLRGSVLLFGPLLARRGRARLAPPGGDFPARRTISTHLDALASMGARMMAHEGHALEVPDGLKPASIYLYEASVTGTETALLAAAAAPGVSEIRHAACEPHVAELCAFLRRLGVGVTGGGTSTIRIEGGAKLHGAEYRLWGDYIEAGSWAVVAAVTGGEIDVKGARPEDMEVVAAVLKRMSIECAIDGDVFRVSAVDAAGGRANHDRDCGPGSRAISSAWSRCWPRRPTGQTLVHDWLYELRLFALEQLSGMGADLFLCDPHRIIVTGPKRLKGRPLDSRDLRSGMALIAAALAGDGLSRVSPLETVERGYSRLVERLRALGGQVEKVYGRGLSLTATSVARPTAGYAPAARPAAARPAPAGRLRQRQRQRHPAAPANRGRRGTRAGRPRRDRARG